MFFSMVVCLSMVEDTLLVNSWSIHDDDHDVGSIANGQAREMLDLLAGMGG